MNSFRFETYENVITKHTINKTEWTQPALWAFYDKLNNSDVTIASARMIDADTVEIVKRIDQNKSLLYKLGLD